MSRWEDEEEEHEEWRDGALPEESEVPEQPHVFESVGPFARKLFVALLIALSIAAIVWVIDAIAAFRGG